MWVLLVVHGRRSVATPPRQGTNVRQSCASYEAACLGRKKKRRGRLYQGEIVSMHALENTVPKLCQGQRRRCGSDRTYHRHTQEPCSSCVEISLANRIIMGCHGCAVREHLIPCKADAATLAILSVDIFGAACPRPRGQRASDSSFRTGQIVCGGQNV